MPYFGEQHLKSCRRDPKPFMQLYLTKILIFHTQKHALVLNKLWQKNVHTFSTDKQTESPLGGNV